MHPESTAGMEGVRALLEQKGRSHTTMVNWGEYQRIDNEETRRGSESGKPREKIVSVDELLQVAHSQ